MKIIEIIVSPKGETKLQTKGFAGSSCREATKSMEKALGIVQSDVATAEMYQTTATTERVRQSNGMTGGNKIKHTGSPS